MTSSQLPVCVKVRCATVMLMTFSCGPSRGSGWKNLKKEIPKIRKKISEKEMTSSCTHWWNAKRKTNLMEKWWRHHYVIRQCIFLKFRRNSFQRKSKTLLGTLLFSFSFPFPSSLSSTLPSSLLPLFASSLFYLLLTQRFFPQYYPQREPNWEASYSETLARLAISCKGKWSPDRVEQEWLESCGLVVHKALSSDRKLFRVLD